MAKWLTLKYSSGMQSLKKKKKKENSLRQLYESRQEK